MQRILEVLQDGWDTEVLQNLSVREFEGALMTGIIDVNQPCDMYANAIFTVMFNLLPSDGCVAKVALLLQHRANALTENSGETALEATNRLIDSGLRLSKINAWREIRECLRRVEIRDSDLCGWVSL